MKIDKELYEKVKKITLTDYEAQYTKDPDDDFVWILNEDTINSMLDDLLYELDCQQEKYDDLKQDLEDNYKRIPISEQVGITDKDFM